MSWREERMPFIVIGAKRGGTWEQCSQKLFEPAEIFRKITIISIYHKYI
jgi:hypothetical protein